MKKPRRKILPLSAPPVLPGKWRLPLIRRSPCPPRIRRPQRELSRTSSARRLASLSSRRMSSLPRGFEPQPPEDLGQRSLAELRETLKRQERLLRNVKFICKLPDKGRKIIDSVAKLKAAIEEHEEVRGGSDLFHPVNLDCKWRTKASTVVDVATDTAQNSDQILDTSSLVPGCSSIATITSSQTTSQRGLVHPTHGGNAEAPEPEHSVSKCPPSSSRAAVPSSSEASERLPQHHISSQVEDHSSSSEVNSS